MDKVVAAELQRAVERPEGIMVKTVPLFSEFVIAHGSQWRQVRVVSPVIKEIVILFFGTPRRSSGFKRCIEGPDQERWKHRGHH